MIIVMVCFEHLLSEQVPQEFHAFSKNTPPHKKKQ